MSIISLPKTTFNLTVENQPVSNAPQRVLFLGQQVDDTSADGVLVTNIQPNGQEDALFGRRSMLASMIRAFRVVNTLSEVDAIPLNDNASSVGATATITFTGTEATAATTFTVSIQSEYFYNFEISVSEGDLTTDIAAKLDTAINASDTLLVTSTDNVDGSITLSVSFNGEVGNSISVNIVGTIPGIVITNTAFASGTLNPDISTILDQVDTIRYQTIVYPSQYDKATIAAFLNTRFNATNNVLDGVAITQQTDASVDLQTDALALDSQSMVILGNKPVSSAPYFGSSLFEFDPVCASYVAGIRSLRLTENANISNLLVGGAGAGNSFGGAWLAAVPYHNTPVSPLPVISSQLGWSTSEQTQLNNNGICFLGNNISRNEIIFGDMVTTYLTNSQGLSDTSFKYLNTVDTGSQIREYFYNNNKEQYAQAVLTAGDIVPLSKQVNVAAFNAFQVSLYVTLSQSPYALVVSGSDGVNFFKQNIMTTVNYEEGIISTTMIVPIVTQVRGINGTLQIAFNLTVNS
jgi:phage tail sheath gpL-like